MPKWTKFRFTIEHAWGDTARLRPAAVARVLVVGDIHGEIKHLTAALERAVALQVDAVVQVGDFWLADDRWDGHDPEEADFMWAAHGAPLPVVVVDGNHEAWPALRKYSATPEAQTAFASRRPVHLGGSLWWAWRGSVWQWGRLGAERWAALCHRIARIATSAVSAGLTKPPPVTISICSSRMLTQSTTGSLTSCSLTTRLPKREAWSQTSDGHRSTPKQHARRVASCSPMPSSAPSPSSCFTGTGTEPTANTSARVPRSSDSPTTDAPTTSPCSH